MRYAEEMGLKTICLTDHFWDETVEGASEWYKDQNYGHIDNRHTTHRQNTEPNPPIQSAVDTPIMLPVPTLDAVDTISA